MEKFSLGLAALMNVDVTNEPSRKMLPRSDSKNGNSEVLTTRACKYACGNKDNSKFASVTDISATIHRKL